MEDQVQPQCSPPPPAVPALPVAQVPLVVPEESASTWLFLEVLASSAEQEFLAAALASALAASLASVLVRLLVAAPC
ncbi:hypothetical protein MTO96_043774 [Rhipicephalus appendiculatus]